MLFQEGFHGEKNVLGNSFGRATFQWVGFECLRELPRQFLGNRVVAVEKVGVVEVFHQPIPDKFQVREVDHEPRFIQLMTTKGEPEGPVVPVYERAMAPMPVLPMGKGDVAIGLRTGKHFECVQRSVPGFLNHDRDRDLDRDRNGLSQRSPRTPRGDKPPITQMSADS